MTTPPITISQFASDPNLLNTPLWPKQAEILEQFWQGDHNLAVWTLGRGSGKTFMAAVVATYAACMLADSYKKYLRSGEKFYIVSIANTSDQAKISLQGVKDLINGSPILKSLIIRETTDTLELSNGAVFRAFPASARGGRGPSCPLVIFDEIGHAIDTEQGNAAGANLFQAFNPSTKRFPGLGKVLMLSTPWIQQGIFWDKYKQASSGNFPSMQLAQYPTWEVNPNITEASLESEKAADPEMFAVEYGANFSQSVASFLDGALIDAAVNLSRGKWVNYPNPTYRGKYYLSLDPAKGGSGRDAYTACIVHYDGDRLVVDLMHQFAPLLGEGKRRQVSIQEVEDWILLQDKNYGFDTVVLDQYNSASTIQRLSSQLNIQELTWTAPRKTETYTKLKELLISGNLELYQHEKLLQQLKNLIVRYRTSGLFDVSGGSGAAVDDFVSALAGAVWIANQKPRYNFDWMLKA